MNKPLWRRAYDELDRTLTPRVEEVVHSDGFARGVATVRQVQRGVNRRLGRATSRAWHLLNLPAGTDVRRLSGQLGALDREVRRLGLELERERRLGGDDAER